MESLSSFSACYAFSSSNYSKTLITPSFISISSSSSAFATCYSSKWCRGTRRVNKTCKRSCVYSPLAPGNSSVDASPTTSVTTAEDVLPKIDKSGRFCSPRAARELALTILYAACLDGTDPIRLFEKRLNARREIGYEFDKTSLMRYDHMSFGGPPVTTETMEEANNILENDQKESDIEMEVLSAPPKLVYSKLILRFTKKLLVAVVEKWDANVLAIDKIAPQNWKKEPAGRILEFSILHLAIAEMVVLRTKHQIVINEAVDLAKRFCVGSAPRIINGCLRTFINELRENDDPKELKLNPMK